VPEGHLIHHYARRQRADLAGRLVRAASPQGRFADGAATIDGRVLRDVAAYASATSGRIVFTKAHARRVYQRDARGRCGTAVATAPVGGRTAYACPRCRR
jgi:formamidopyrimidine-DNA glycosylase